MMPGLDYLLYSSQAQESQNLVVERREVRNVAPVTMNAFELISTSQGLNLNSLFEKKMVWSNFFYKKSKIVIVIFHIVVSLFALLASLIFSSLVLLA